MDDPLLNGLGPIGQFLVHQTALYRKNFGAIESFELYPARIERGRSIGEGEKFLGRSRAEQHYADDCTMFWVAPTTLLRASGN